MSTTPQLDKELKKIKKLKKLEAAKAPPLLPSPPPPAADPKTDQVYDDEPWPSLPSENEKPPKEPFPLRALPLPMQAYCKSVAESTGTPIDYAALAV